MSVGASMGRAAGWLRRRPMLGDTAIAAGLAALWVPSMYLSGDLLRVPTREPDALGLLLVALGCAPLALRRRYPVLVSLAVTVPVAVLAVLEYAGGGNIAGVMIAVYTAAAYADRRRAVLAFLGAWVCLMAALPFYDLSFGAADVAAVTGLLLAAHAFGRSIGFRRAYTTELELRAAQLEHARAADVRVVVAQERGRIARELHDVVAHHVSVMTVQAAGARRTLERDPVRSAEALAAIEATGRAALAEMRRIVGVLRDEGEQPGGDLLPQPGVADLDRLVEQVREAGLRVAVSVEGEPVPLPVGVDLAVYRVVQEALTNCLKHAGHTTARVTLTYGPGDVTVRVVDRGLGAAAAPSGTTGEHTGHGLPGMRERVALYGGQLRVGPRASGGFEVWTRIPLEQTAYHGERSGPVPA